MIIQHVAAWIAIAGFSVMTCFQILLALGKPLGHMAWGGKYKRLPKGLRIASFVSSGIFVFGALCVLERAGILLVLNWPGGVKVTVWILTVLFGLSTIGNFNSKSKLEKKIMTPVSAVLAAMCFILSISAG